MPRVLRTDVYVAGLRFQAGTTPPDEYARRITNPAAWTGADDMSTPASSNDTSAIGPATKVVAVEPTGVTGGPEPRPGPTPADQPAEPGSATDTATGPATGPAATGPAASDPVASDPVTDPAPPRSGKGSGLDAWDSYARTHGVTVPDGADRAALIAACENAGLIAPA